MIQNLGFKKNGFTSKKTETLDYTSDNDKLEKSKLISLKKNIKQNNKKFFNIKRKLSQSDLNENSNIMKKVKILNTGYKL